MASHLLLALALAASSLAAAVERASTGVEIQTFDTAGQGCITSRGENSILVLPASSTPTCYSFAAEGVPYAVKSAESLSYFDKTCKVVFVNACGDEQGTPDEGLDHCQSGNFGGVQVSCS